MPTYQYACTACDHRFEQVQAFSDPSLAECPECSGRLRKLYGSVGVVFKGSGFYRTDSRAKSSAASGSSDKSEKKETGAAAKETTSSSSGADKSPSTSSSTSTTTPAAKAS